MSDIRGEFDNDDDDFSFDDFDLEVGLNFFLGLQSRTGMFLELKVTAYAEPNLRFGVGYRF